MTYTATLSSSSETSSKCRTEKLMPTSTPKRHKHPLKYYWNYHTTDLKLFLAARRKMRESSDSYSAELFINKNLTPYKFSLMKMLKNERVKRRNDQAPSYETVYTFEGIVYVKMKRDDPNDQAIAVRSRTILRGLLTKLDATNSSRASAWWVRLFIPSTPSVNYGLRTS